jgi:DNA-directed RNA polymerase specialized sigma24 family protein
VIQKTKNVPRSAKVRRKAANGKRVARVHVELKKVPDRLDGDRALVAAAIQGNPGAWSHLYERFHERLLSASRAILRRYHADSHLIDEIAARVWYALIKDDFDLLRRYDTNRGCRFSTFLSLLAKNETKMFLRSERRRRDRERVSSRTLDQIAQIEFDTQSAEEFLLTLTPTERTFYQQVLVHSDEPAEGNADYSSSNVWQLTRRVKKKLQAFLGT